MTLGETLIARTRELGIQLWVSDGTLNFRAPRAAFTPELRAELQLQKASILDVLCGPRFDAATPVAAIDMPEGYVELWHQVQTGAFGIGYSNLTNILYRLRCPVDLDTLARTLDRLVRQHDGLRVRVTDDTQGLRFVFDCEPALTVVDLSGAAPADLEAMLANAARELAWRPFAAGECLFRPFVLKLPSAEFAIGLVVHHFIVDGWSFGQIFGGWMLEYEKQLNPALQTPEIASALNYSAFIRAMSEWSRTANFRRRREYWRHLLRDAKPCRLPPDHDADPDVACHHRGQAFHVDAAHVTKLRERAASLGVTFCDLLLAGVALAMHHELKSPDICLRHLWHGRDDPRLFQMIGSTVNPVLLRVRVNPDCTLSEIATQVHRVAVDAFANHLPLDRDGITVLLEDDFVCKASFLDTALEMVNRFDRPFDILMFDCMGKPREAHRIGENIYRSDGETFPTYWGSHVLFINNGSIPRILEAKQKFNVMDIDGFFLQPSTGLEVYQFYTGKSRQLYFGSRVSSYTRSLFTDAKSLLWWYFWTRGFSRPNRKATEAAVAT